MEIGRDGSRQISDTLDVNPLTRHAQILLYMRDYMLGRDLLNAGLHKRNNTSLRHTVPDLDVLPVLSRNEDAHMERRYLSEWFRTESEIVFYLSDGTLQFNIFHVSIVSLKCNTVYENRCIKEPNTIQLLKHPKAISSDSTAPV